MVRNKKYMCPRDLRLIAAKFSSQNSCLLRILREAVLGIADMLTVFSIIYVSGYAFCRFSDLAIEYVVSCKGSLSCIWKWRLESSLKYCLRSTLESHNNVCF